jgi:group II intron reverse transcriptase/maturase
MQSAQTYLEVVSRRGERRLELRRVYRQLQNQEWYLLAYAKLYRNAGALTPGVDSKDTVDAMSLKRIDDIISAVKKGSYRWKPVRRHYISKKNGKLRPLGLPSWSDKLLQEVLRIILSAYYEPQFSENSHGFRPGRGCHTALQDIYMGWKGTKWFIEGDIKGCFDNISHSKLLEIIRRSIRDERLIKLLKGMLDAGYLEDWTHHQTYSGVPQGGVLSPLLTNVFLNELDVYVEQSLMPHYTKGERRQVNPEYASIQQAKRKAKKNGDVRQYRLLRKEQQRRPSKVTDDPEYRRLRYCRYADDFLLGFVGTRQEAEEVRQKIGELLQTLDLSLSEEKTLITHATEESAQFLGYEIHMAMSNTRMCKHIRSINGHTLLKVPDKVAKEWKTRYTHKGKPCHRKELLEQSDHDIVTTYGMELQGLVNYYALAYDVSRKLYPVKWA